jgi:thiamine biosynthesis lipoprotein
MPLLQAWGFRDETADVDAARELVGYEQIAIEENRIGLERKGAGMDLGGIAKGYAVDRAAAILRDKWNIRNAIVEAGGDLYVIGRPEDAEGWMIGIADPTNPDGVCATVRVADCALATSGTYRTRRTREGVTYSDIFATTDGKPSAAFASLTMCAATCMDADAASKPLFSGAKGAAEGLTGMGISWIGVNPDGANGLAFEASSEFPKWETV